MNGSPADPAPAAAPAPAGRRPALAGELRVVEPRRHDADALAVGEFVGEQLAAGVLG